MSARPLLYADFSNADQRGRLRLTCRGTIDDLKEKGIQLKEGLELALSDYQGLEANGTVAYSQEEKIWVAIISWDEIRDVPVERTET